MSVRVDTSPLIAGALVVGHPGLGIPAGQIPDSGEHGAGYAYSSLIFPADANKAITGRVTTWPTLGTLYAYEDTSFVYKGLSDTFQWQLYVDGVATGEPQTVSLAVGSASGALVVANPSQTHIAETPTLSSASVLTLANAAQAHTTQRPQLAFPGLFAQDDFFGVAAGTTLQAHDTRWVRHPVFTLNITVSAIGAAQATATGTSASAYYYNAAPPSADYTVRANLVATATVGTTSPDIGVMGRMHASANTGYLARYNSNAGQWALYRFVSSVATLLATNTEPFGAAGTRRQIELKMLGSTLRVIVDGVEKINFTDNSPITATGYAGVRVIGRTALTTLQLDNFAAFTMPAS